MSATAAPQRSLHCPGDGAPVGAAAQALQEQLLAGVSRTFALTIPQLPPALRHAVANAYLLCRILDTVEDEAALTAAQKDHFCAQFVEAVAGMQPPERFSRELAPLLCSGTLPAEHELIRVVPAVLAITHGLPQDQRQAIERCVRIMAEGMPQFQRGASSAGLSDLAMMDRYCYYVAGVVGEMLTALFCSYSPQIAAHRSELLRLAVAFGQGLQMTNILKDVWEDFRRGVCWLPQDVFGAEGCELARLQPGLQAEGFGTGIAQLIAVAHSHLHEALEYTLLIPAHETGIRHFCLWALGMAVLTLRRIDRHRDYSAGSQVKISRRSVRPTVATMASSPDTIACCACGLRSPDTGWRAMGNEPRESTPAHGETPSLPASRRRRSLSARARKSNRERAARGGASHRRARAQQAGHPGGAGLEAAIDAARERLLHLQHDAGYWCFELEADCTIPAEYVLMMHFMDEIEAALQERLARYLRAQQGEDGGWPLYHGGEANVSCSVKAYYALKLAGDSPDAPHMARARAAILGRGGAARATCSRASP